MIGFSAALHLALFLIAIIIGAITKERVFITPTLTVELVAPAKKQSKKKQTATPVKKKTKKKAVTKKTTEKKKITKKETVKVSAEAKAEAALTQALSSLEKDVLDEGSIEESLSKLQKDVDERQSEVERISEDIKRSADAEKYSVATAKVSREIFELKFKAYYSQLQEQIRHSWVYPSDPGDLFAIYSLVIAPDGELLRVWKEEGSGNSLFDESGLKAIKKAAPFPPLPAELGTNDHEIGVRFCPNCK